MLRISVLLILLLDVAVFAQHWILIPNAVKDSLEAALGINQINNSRLVHFVDDDTGIIYANQGDYDATAIYRTTDGGYDWLKVWQWKYEPPYLKDYLEASEIVFHGKDTGWIPIAMNSRFISEGYWQDRVVGILKTIDGGSTWLMITPILGANGDTLMGDLPCVSFPTSTIGWLAMWNRIFRTTDGGLTWTEQTDIDTARGAYATIGIHFSDTLKGMMVTDNCIYRTSDGHHWATKPFSFPETVGGFANGGLHFITPDTAFIFAPGVYSYTGYSDTGFRTTDFGTTWSKFLFPHAVPYPVGCFNVAASFVNVDTGWYIGSDQCASTAQSPYDCNCMTVQGHTYCDICYRTYCNDNCFQIMRTVDGGQSWTREPVSHGCYLNSIFMLNDSTGWAVGERGDVEIFSNSVASIKKRNSGPPAAASEFRAFIHGSRLIVHASLPSFSSLRMLDLQGKTLWKTKATILLKGETTFVFPINRISTGIYILTVGTTGGTFITPVFVRK